MPESSRIGIINMLVRGAMTSSLFAVSAKALDAPAAAAPVSRVMRMPSTTPSSGASIPKA